jgi:hypothetical protein
MFDMLNQLPGKLKKISKSSFDKLANYYQLVKSSPAKRLGWYVLLILTGIVVSLIPPH